MAASATADTGCPRPANRPAADGSPIDPKIALKAEAATEAINFGGDRGTKSIDVILLASRPLPKTFSVKQLEIDSPKRFARIGQMQETTSLKMLRFSNPQIIEHRRKIRVRVCVDTSSAAPGIYGGQVNFSGPSGLAGTTVTMTVNAKLSDGRFMFFLFLALAAAFLLLLFKAAKEAKKDNEQWRHAIQVHLKDPTFIVSTIIALGAALVAMRAIYDSDPAWGADTWTSFFALCGTAFGAAGVGSLVSAFTPQSRRRGSSARSAKKAK